MLKLAPVFVLTIVCGCHRQVTVPTARELIANRLLLTEWQGRCETGEYSRFTPARKAELCSTTQEATISVSEIEAGKKAEDLFGAATRRR